MRKLFTSLVLSASLAFILGLPTARAADDIIFDDTADGFDATNPVPEPTGLLIMGLGLAAVAYSERRRRA